MLKFSLIIPTINRKYQLDNLLNSIKNCNYKNFEVIIVDQNNNTLIDDIIEKYMNSFELKHLKVKFKGAAKARNYGFDFATGDIINFPDDDCEFSQDTLERVNNIFLENKDIDAVFGRSIDKQTGGSSVVKFIEKKIFVNEKNLYKTTVEYTMFIKKNVFKDLGMYDETFGVGTFYGAEEGADFVLRGIYKKKNFLYDPSIIFYHPDKKIDYNINRAYNYGKGFGRLFIKHLFEFKKLNSIVIFFNFNIKSIIAIFLYIITFRFKKAKYYYYTLIGRITGCLCTTIEYFNRKG